MNQPQPGYGIRSNTPLRTIFRAWLFLFVVAVVVLEYPGLKSFIETPDNGLDMRNLVIQNVTRSSPNASANIRVGDEVLAIDSENVRNQSHYRYLLASHKNSQPQIYRLRRAEREHEVLVQYGPLPSEIVYIRFAFLLVALAFIGVGTWVYLRRPDILGYLFASICAMLAFFLTDRPPVGSPILQIAGEIFSDAMILLLPAVLLNFFVIFPVRIQNVRRPLRVRIAYLYVLPAVLFAIGAFVAVRRFFFIDTSDVAVTMILAGSALYFVAYVLASLIVFLRGYRRAPVAQKQKLRVVMAGTSVGLIPLLAVMVYRAVRPGEMMALESMATLCLGFIPTTFAYAILKHGAIELNDVVRKSLVYAFLTGALIAAYYTFLQSVSDFLVRQIGLSEMIWMPIAIVLFAMLFAPARARVERIVDRMFYRGDYDYQQEVVEFNRQLARQLTADDVTTFSASRLQTLFQPAYVAVYISTNGHSELTRHTTLGGPVSLPDKFNPNCFLGRYFSRFKRPLLVEFLDQSWERPNLDLESSQFLTADKLGVCIPITAPDRLIGIVMLGAKRSGLPYRRIDSDLLETFFEQIGLVLQNAELMEASLEKERLKGEVMLARDIQLSLLPEQAPSTGGFDIQGRMVSSFEVGGDYFDYFPIDDKRVGVAIGDVSGKGIPAAMLMSSLRAVFKNRALKGKLSPAELNQDLNEYLYENAKVEQFATFFYGILEINTGRFVYSNAGQCPALLIKADYADRLGEGGMILGAMPGQTYQEGTAYLDHEDLLLLYTDGIIEQKNDQGEEYGEDRLITFLQVNRKMPVAELQDAMFKDVMAFGNGRQDDDITSIIAYRSVA